MTTSNIPLIGSGADQITLMELPATSAELLIDDGKRLPCGCARMYWCPEAKALFDADQHKRLIEHRADVVPHYRRALELMAARELLRQDMATGRRG